MPGRKVRLQELWAARDRKHGPWEKAWLDRRCSKEDSAAGVIISLNINRVVAGNGKPIARKNNAIYQFNPGFEPLELVVET